MQIDEDQQAELGRFPLPLRALIDAELAVGNTIVEIGHSFPAPPVGAYCKLSKHVTSRTRDSDDQVDFYDRNSSIYSGEFTDAKRYFFVLEPPHPQEPEPDMDAIRRGLNSQVDAAPQAATPPSAAEVQTSNQKQSQSKRKRARTFEIKEHSKRVIQELYSTGASWLMYFRDQATPDEIQAELEEEVRTIFTPALRDGILSMSANARVVGARYKFELRYEAALPDANHYSLHIQADWKGFPENTHEYFRKSCNGWIDLWTRNLQLYPPPSPDENLPEKYKSICDSAMIECARLNSIETIRDRIIAAVKAGATYSSSHKEGGTVFSWESDHYLRYDFGDYPGQDEYHDDAAFLQAIKQFFHWDVHRNAGDTPLTDLEVWTLLYRMMRL